MISIRDFTAGTIVINKKERNKRKYVVTGTWQDQVSYHPPEDRGQTYQKPYTILEIIED